MRSARLTNAHTWRSSHSNRACLVETAPDCGGPAPMRIVPTNEPSADMRPVPAVPSEQVKSKSLPSSNACARSGRGSWAITKEAASTEVPITKLYKAPRGSLSGLLYATGCLPIAGLLIESRREDRAALALQFGRHLGLSRQCCGVRGLGILGRQARHPL